MAGISLNTNLAALSAQRNLTVHTAKLSRTFEHLSSGLRITRAGDDASGLSVASLLDVDRRVLTQATRNLNDGISYLNIAEGGASNLSNIVIRIRELAEQSANGVLGTNQRTALQQEVTALEAEYNRIVKSTSFNGRNLLTGDTAVSLAAGYGTNGTLDVRIGGAVNSQSTDNSTGNTKIITVSSSGASGNANVDTNGISMSGDGRYIVFASTATNLVSGDTNGVSDVFLRDMLLGTTTRVSVGMNGAQSDGVSQNAQISTDGRFIVFASDATNLVAGDTNGRRDVFRYEVATGNTTRVSLRENGTQNSIGFADSAQISADGRYVTFQSTSLVIVPGDTNGVADVFMHDTVTRTNERISVATDGTQSNAVATSLDMSADGRFVLLESSANNLAPNVTHSGNNIFLRDRLTGTTSLVSVSINGGDANGLSENARISADGRYVMFNSDSTDLVAGDTNGVYDVFVRDLLLGTTTRISVAPDGTQGNSDSYGSDISADGRYILFNSDATNLISGDTNGATDAFIYDMIDRTTRRISVGTNGEQADGGYANAVMSSDGRYASFESVTSNVVAGDTNGFADYFLRDTSLTGVQQISGMIVSDQASARVTLDMAKRYHEEIQSYLGQIGASVSRATAYNETLKVGVENISAARAQITDADFASETASLISTQILQGATSAVLAQANRQPALALQLLAGE